MGASLKYVIPISVIAAIVVLWIIAKICRMIGLKKKYKELVGKVVVITGASGGLGEALAHEFYKRGTQLVLCARRKEELERVKNDILKTHTKTNNELVPIIIPLDLNEADQMHYKVDQILSKTGHIDILVNNAGIANVSRIKDTTLDVFDKLMKVNYIGTVALTKAVLPDMLKIKKGQIVFISSVGGLISAADLGPYYATKHALQAFGDSLRAEVAADDISVCVVSPGYMKTQILANAFISTGELHGKTVDKPGLTPEYAAEHILKAIVLKKKEYIIGLFIEKFAVYLRRRYPSVYFYVIAQMAKKVHPMNEAVSIEGVQSRL